MSSMSFIGSGNQSAVWWHERLYYPTLLTSKRCFFLVYYGNPKTHHDLPVVVEKKTSILKAWVKDDEVGVALFSVAPAEH